MGDSLFDFSGKPFPISLSGVLGIDLLPPWDFGEERCLHVLVIVVAAEVVHAVADYEEVGVEDGIVALDLGEDGLRDADVWSLVLDDDEGVTVEGGIDNGVATTLHTGYLEGHLIADEERGIAEGVDKIMHEMLAHPLLGCQRDEAPTLLIEDAETAVRPLRHAGIDGRKIEGGKHVVRDVSSDNNED